MKSQSGGFKVYCYLSYKKEKYDMNIKPSDKTIKELLGSKKQFVIPRFQREYSWDKSNYKEFLDDMVDCLKIEGGKVIPTQYFLGTMLFIGNISDDTIKEILVVDGQQRMTVITILFSAISERFKQIDQKILSEKIFEYIMASDDDGKPVRILKSNSHYPFFAFYIQEKDKTHETQPNSEEEECIEKTYMYLYNQLDEANIRKTLCSKFGKDTVSKISYVDILKAIRDQVLGTTFISICTPDHEQANMIFEILNAKGKRLSCVDLIKNKIFEVLDDTEPADFAEEKWKLIKKVLSSVTDGVGLSTFYRHFWCSKYRKTSERNLYSDFEKEIQPRDKTVYTSFLNTLEKEAKNYIKIISPDRAHYKNKKEYYSLVQSLNILSNYFEIVQVRIAILALFDAKEKGLISCSDLTKIVQYFEHFHFAYNALLKSPTNKLESIYSKFAIELRKATDKTAAKSAISSVKQELNSIFPDYTRFEEAFISLTYEKPDGPFNMTTKYIINKINCYYDGSKLFDDDLSIEHILPESENVGHINIGNLIALELDLNREADNLSYADKINIYTKSKYKWIADFIKENGSWTTPQFEDRAKQLAKLFYTKIIKK